MDGRRKRRKFKPKSEKQTNKQKQKEIGKGNAVQKFNKKISYFIYQPVIFEQVWAKAGVIKSAYNLQQQQQQKNSQAAAVCL